MGGYRGSAKNVISLRCFIFEGCSCFEAVDEKRGSAFAVGMGEEVEHLQAARVGEIGRVCVGAEGEGGVGGVFGGEVGCKIPEASYKGVSLGTDGESEGKRPTIMGCADEGDPLQKSLGC